MTTTPIPDAAIEVAETAVKRCRKHPHRLSTWECCIQAALAAAVPLLGEVRTERMVRFTCDGEQRRHRTHIETEWTEWETVRD